jgi:IS1 family transposase/transposase-like protein
MILFLGFVFVSITNLLLNIAHEPEFSQDILQVVSLKINCPSCDSHNVIKNGSIHNGKQKYECKDCKRQFVENPNNIVISVETKQLIDKLLLERISLRRIARVTEVSLAWLQNYVNDKLSRIPRQIRVSEKDLGRLVIECDEMWSFVASKKNDVYIWLAIDRDTREIVGCFLGNRTRKSARQLWESLPLVYRQCAIAHTDFWQSYKKVIPSHRHHASGKDAGQTNHIERLNNTFRQRLSRLVRMSLSFSKKLENHIGAVWYFIHHYNAELANV